MRVKDFKIKPSFLIIGAQRAGTTSLYNYLIDNPLVYSSRRKELHFFDFYYSRGIDWYRNQFKYSFFNKTKKITGEATPYYLFHPLVPARVNKYFPEMKFIVLLRNPIDRAYSHYKFNFSKGIEKRSFQEAIKREEEIIQPEFYKMMNDHSYYSFDHQNYSYLERGKYACQIKRWFSIFPREQFLFIKSEDFFMDSKSVMSKVFDFIGVDNINSEFLKKYNEVDISNVIDSKIRTELVNYYADHNIELDRLLGAKFNWR